jgi:UPF0755 protein
MDNFGRTPRRPRQPQGPSTPPVPPVTPPASASQPSTQFAPQPLEDTTTGITPAPARKPRRKRILWILAAIIVLIGLVCGGAYLWYVQQLSAVNADDTTKQLVKIESGTTPTQIADKLEQSGLVRNATVFLWYSRLNGVQNKLQAGSYRLSPSESTPEIISHIVNGSVDTFSITFLPGSTLAQNRKVLIDAGYSESTVDAALNTSYDSPLFAGKPAGTDLEGYLYGETYTFNTDTSVKAILEKVFEEFYAVVKENDLVDKYADHGLSLYEGITLASIIQREASVGGTDMPQIAQVFYSRYAIGMPLGSDVTYQYIADKMGVARDTNLDSPYNTRRYAGLPPGPIAVPGEKALLATANPAEGDYLYFLSGDDGITYFARTSAEHEANIQNHCQTKCQIL